MSERKGEIGGLTHGTEQILSVTLLALLLGLLRLPFLSLNQHPRDALDDRPALRHKGVCLIRLSMISQCPS